MHIEPGLVDGAQIWLSYATAAGAIGYAGEARPRSRRRVRGATSLLGGGQPPRTALVFCPSRSCPTGRSACRNSTSSSDRLCSSSFAAAPAVIGLALGLLMRVCSSLRSTCRRSMERHNAARAAVRAVGDRSPDDRADNGASRSDLRPRPSPCAVDDVPGGDRHLGGVLGDLRTGAEWCPARPPPSGACMPVVVIEPLVDLAALAVAKALQTDFKGSSLFECLPPRRRAETRCQVASYVDFYVQNLQKITRTAKYIQLNGQQEQATQDALSGSRRLSRDSTIRNRHGQQPA